MTAKETWKPVTIGGLTGVLMGAGTVYATQLIASMGSDELPGAEEGGLKVAEVDDGMSFSQAFNAAREQVGAGGVFTWCGNIFNTYTADEWKAMSDDDKKLFAEQVKPEVPAAEVDTNQLAEAEEDVQVSEQQEDVRVAEQQNYDIEETHRSNYEAQLQATTWNDIAQEQNDVRVVGFKDIAVADGRSVSMQELDINGQRVAVIDVDKDGEPDIAMTDLNHNNQMDEGEVIDLHTGEAISFANDDSIGDSTPDIDAFTA